MNSIINNIKVLFCDAQPEKVSNVLQDKNNVNLKKDYLSYNHISKEQYCKYAYDFYPNKSLDEREVYYSQLDTNSYFDLLSNFGEKTIILNGDIPLINFEKIIEWREVTHLIGQAEIVTSFLAKKTINSGAAYSYWNWPTALKTNNMQLLSILRKGISENHYHLNGSTQVFPISWVSIMNNPTIIKNRINKIEENLYPRLSSGVKDNSDSWGNLLKNAAIIRLKLFTKLYTNGEIEEFKNCNVIELVSFSEIEQIAKRIAYLFAFKTNDGKALDYALTKDLGLENYGYNRILVGERIFLYDCFKAAFSGDFTEIECNEFYYYLLVKNRFRSELIQSNNRVGFKNFSKYQDRKEYFFEGIDKYEKEAVRLSLNDTLQCQSIKSLETRIMPKKTHRDLYDSIRFYDDCYNKAKNEGKMLSLFKFYDEISEIYNATSIKENKKPPYFFVLHYPKNRSPINYKNDLYKTTKIITKPRNALQRHANILYTRTTAYMLSRKNYMRDRVRGIDTCSFEIYCRPEVFATDFRCLKNYHSVDSIVNHSNNKKIFLQLGRTYHAGEDFYDLVDGVRAIDELIRYMDYSNGDRIGHALALGLDPYDYYEFKNKRIGIPKQEALDNFLWLYFRSAELNISVEPLLQHELLCKINELSSSIYGEFCKNNNIEITSQKLYNAWKLRGDSPDLYNYKGFQAPLQTLNQYEGAKFVDSYELNELRKNTQIAQLYYAYHYDYTTRKVGEEFYEFEIDQKYINLVKDVQKKLQFEISRKDIMIECNPSSNYLISTIKDYESHPITTFNNMDLEFDYDLLKNCAQLSVSINTDDQGVFDTSLEYEYALIASALIRAVNKNGECKYTPSQVYKYIDSIREMGNRQTFLKA